MERDLFQVDFGGIPLIGDILPAGARPNVIFLHGAGKADRARYDYIRLSLARDGISSCSFDFIGHGATGGDLQASSLKERTNQARAVIETLSLSQPLKIIAGSMSAYTAIKLTEYYKIDGLVLIVPGIYRADVYETPFGPEFSQKIRESRSWLKSDAWAILAKYTGKLLIISAEDDKIVTSEIPQKIFDAAKKTSSRRLHTVKKAPHQIREYLVDPSHKEDFDQCYALIKDALG